MRCMVTGATGFIGSRLTAMLLDEQHDVACLVRPGSQADSLPDEAQVYVVDAQQPETIERAVQAFSPDTVFHLATHYPSRFEAQTIPVLVDANILFGSLLMHFAVAHGVKRFVAAGSTMQTHPEHGDRASNFYAATKTCFETVLDYYADHHAIQARTLYLFDSYGPNDRRPKLLNRFLSLGEDEQPLPLTDGTQRMGLVHVDDICRGFILSAHQMDDVPAPGRTHEALPSARPVSVRELAAMVESARGVKLPLAWGAVAQRPGQIMEPYSPYPPLPGWSEQEQLLPTLRAMAGQSG